MNLVEGEPIADHTQFESYSLDDLEWIMPAVENCVLYYRENFANSVDHREIFEGFGEAAG